MSNFETRTVQDTLEGEEKELAPSHLPPPRANSDRRPRISSCSSAAADQNAHPKLRHAASSGGFTSAADPTSNDGGGLRRRARTSSYRRERRPTAESPGGDDHQHRMATFRHQSSIMMDDSELPYADDDDEGDGAAAAAAAAIRPVMQTARQRRFARSQSECVPSAPGAATVSRWDGNSALLPAVELQNQSHCKF